MRRAYEETELICVIFHYKFTTPHTLSAGQKAREKA